jgi:prepilin-type N-terminal cleavage/methylation domain-containing protein
MKTTFLNPRAVRGFTLIEILIVIGIIGILLAVGYPSILNTLAVRNLDNTARQIQTFLQQTKLQAVSTKIVHRARFFRVDNSYWAYEMERLQPDGTWIKASSIPRKVISDRFNVTIHLPASGTDPIVIFSPVGAMANFAANQNTIVIQSPRVDRLGQMDERVLSLFMGGSVYYAKKKSS